MDRDDELPTPALTTDGPFICPVCGYDGLGEPPYNADGDGSYEICPSCGFEFGFDDHSEGVSHDEFRATWLAAGATTANRSTMPKCSRVRTAWATGLAVASATAIPAPASASSNSTAPGCSVASYRPTSVCRTR